MQKFRGEAVDVLLSEPDERVLSALEGVEDDVLVLGAGGKMGLHLCNMVQRGLQALGKKHKVKAVSRFSRPEQREPFAELGIDILACDLSDVQQLDRLPDVAEVFFMAGVKFGTSSSPELLQRMNVDMPRQVAEKFKRSRIVAYSTGCVYSFVDIDSGGSTEESETKPVGEYALSCLGREQAFVDASKEFGTRCALIRLNYAVEFRYGVLVDVAQKVLAGEPIDVTTGHVNVIWQRDAVSYSISALRDVSSPPFILNVTGPDTVRVRDIAERFGKIFDRKVTITGEEAQSVWLNNPSKSHRLYGPPTVSLDTMVEWVAEWLGEGGATLGKPTGFERRDGNF